MSKDAIALLRQDHRAVEELFRRFEDAGERAHKTKGRLVDQMIEALSIHSAIEEQIFYPAARETLEDHPILEALEEHHIAKVMLAELERMKPEDERYNAKVHVMMEMIRHHIDEEEEELFPTLREKLGRSRLVEIGEALIEARKMAPTRPHPRMPDQPPANVLLGGAAAAADKVIDLTRGAVQKARGRR